MRPVSIECHHRKGSITVTNSAGVSKDVTFTGRRVSAIRNNFGTDRVLGHFGGGLEYFHWYWRCLAGALKTSQASH